MISSLRNQKSIKRYHVSLLLASTKMISRLSLKIMDIRVSELFAAGKKAPFVFCGHKSRHIQVGTKFVSR